MIDLCEKCGGPLPTPEQWERGACDVEVHRLDDGSAVHIGAHA